MKPKIITHKIQAIKDLRAQFEQAYGVMVGLKEAKELIEHVMSKQTVSIPASLFYAMRNALPMSGDAYKEACQYSETIENNEPPRDTF